MSLESYRESLEISEQIENNASLLLNLNKSPKNLIFTNLVLREIVNYLHELRSLKLPILYRQCQNLHRDAGDISLILEKFKKDVNIQDIQPEETTFDIQVISSSTDGTSQNIETHKNDDKLYDKKYNQKSINTSLNYRIDHCLNTHIISKVKSFLTSYFAIEIANADDKIVLDLSPLYTGLKTCSNIYTYITEEHVKFTEFERKRKSGFDRNNLENADHLFSNYFNFLQNITVLRDIPLYIKLLDFQKYIRLMETLCFYMYQYDEIFIKMKLWTENENEIYSIKEYPPRFINVGEKEILNALKYGKSISDYIEPNEKDLNNMMEIYDLEIQEKMKILKLPDWRTFILEDTNMSDKISNGGEKMKNGGDKIDNSKEKIDNSEEKINNSEEKIDNCEEKIDNSEENQENNVDNHNENHIYFANKSQKFFKNINTFKSHIQSKKYLKKPMSIPLDQHYSKFCKIEALFHFFLSERLSESLYETITLIRTISTSESNILSQKDFFNIQLNRSKIDQKESPVENDDIENDDIFADRVVYNPKKLPVDYDGKPIPFWQYKLLGLNESFVCEICGDHTYWSRDGWNRHFNESRHAIAMRKLGIPNTAHFKGIDKIADCQNLYDKLKKDAESQNFNDEVDVECEDSEGTVMNLKTYRDLVKQGLI